MLLRSEMRAENGIGKNRGHGDLNLRVSVARAGGLQWGPVGIGGAWAPLPESCAVKEGRHTGVQLKGGNVGSRESLFWMRETTVCF